MTKINKTLLPIKAHYFFFMAAMGPILPQLNVIGKQLGISPSTMGWILSVLPLLYVLAKPAVGFLADYFSSLRKAIFMTVLLVMTLSYSGFYFVPRMPTNVLPEYSPGMFDMSNLTFQQCNSTPNFYTNLECTTHQKIECDNSCSGFNSSITGYVSKMSLMKAAPLELCFSEGKWESVNKSNCAVFCNKSPKPNHCSAQSSTFWTFILLMCLGTIGFNVGNCISDAICFDMLGESTMKYGHQRVWGTIGFGLTALLSGIAVNHFTKDDDKSIVPALVIMLFFSGFDLLSVKWLKLPKLGGTDSIYRDIKSLIKDGPIAIFLVFATLAGIFDSFIIYYMFWHLEVVAAASGHMGSIKLIEGIVVAAECLGGEIIFFLISGKILKKIGYVHCLTFCFLMYALRLGLISLITNPWWLVAIEFFMQGPSYALCYTCIVAYASAIAPPGTSATVQGLVAGMDDGVGFALGSMIGGQMFSRLGGKDSFRIFGCGALITCIMHIFLRPAAKHETQKGRASYEVPPEQAKPSIDS